MTRAVVNVATDSWVVGQRRLEQALYGFGETSLVWTDTFPAGCPPHRAFGKLAAPQNRCVPYAFKAFALQDAARIYDMLIWADACILPIRPLDKLWERIERDGYWFARNG